jgi:hypothetical protein
MIRRFLITLACIAIPFLLYWLYTRIKKQGDKAGRDPWPLAILWLTGAVIAIEAMVLSVVADKGLTAPPVSPAALEQQRNQP